MSLTRRQLLQGTAGLALSSLIASGLRAQSTQPAAKPKRLLFFTKSQGFPHSVVTPTSNQPIPLAEKLLKEWTTAAGHDLTISKDGSLFTPEFIASFDAFIFYTTGDLTKPPATPKSDQTPLMTDAGKTALLNAIAAGKGFVGLHSATDTFQNLTRKSDPVTLAKPDTVIDPYCKMLGAEFTSHAKQQTAKTRVVTHDFPGLENLQDFEITEEWYALTNIATDLHVLLVQDTTSMKVNPKTNERDPQYRGVPYPSTWARMHNKGRVFYTSMGHRDDVWQSDRYQQIVMAAIAWATRLAGDDVTPNLAQACPDLK